MGDLGLLGHYLPGGSMAAGLDYWYQVVMLEEMGRANCAGVPMAIAVQTDMATPALAEFGSDPWQKETFLQPAVAGNGRLLHRRQ
jgi:citronellyl-CoA dehydrogenase